MLASTLFLWGCGNPTADDFGTFTCDAESTTDVEGVSFFSGDGALFSGGSGQDGAQFFEGTSSFKLEGDLKEGMALEINNVITNQFIEASVWRYDPTGKAQLVMVDEEGKLNAVESFPIIQKENGWEKLLLRVTLPPNIYKRKIHIKVVNPSESAVWFDNLSVQWLERAVYPEYAEEEKLEVTLPRESYEEMKAWRDSCFVYGMMTEDAKRYFDGAVRWKGVKMPAKIRLKGDLLDHVKGYKWSLRVSIKGEYSVMGMKSFSLQDPKHRNYMDEWLAHKACIEADILTTRYRFVPVHLNQKNLGIFAIEEHFEKQLVEHQNRREGPILKFNEEGYWQYQQLLYAGHDSLISDLQLRNSATIGAYKKSRILANSNLSKQFIVAKDLLYSFHHQHTGWERTIDKSRTAKFVALSHLFGESKNTAWHNQRWYYNPVVCRLEPIGHHFNVGYTLAAQDQFLKRLDDEYMDANKAFLSLTQSYWEQFATEEFRQRVIDRNKEEYDRSMALLEKEFGEITVTPWRKVDPATAMEAALKEPTFYDSEKSPHLKNASINAYYYSRPNDSMQVTIVENFMNKGYKIIGTGDKKSMIMGNPIVEEPLSKRPFAEKFVTHKPAKNLYYTMSGDETIYAAPISAWSRPEGKPGPTAAEGNIYELAKKSFIELSGDTIRIKPGLIALNENLVFPAGFKVVADGPNQIVLNNGAGILSYSPVFIKGTAQNMIKIHSTDKTGQGLTVMSTGSGTRSELAYVVFENLNTVNRNNWTLTGAVTFYESDVTVNSCKFMSARCEDALNTVRCNFEVKNSSFHGSFSDAFDADFCTGSVSGCAFVNIGNDAIDFSGSQVNISTCEIIFPGDKGISGGENSQLAIQDVMIEGGVIAIASKDFSSLTVSNVTLINNLFGFAAFRKKPEYGPATIHAQGANMEGVKQIHAIETGSLLMLDQDSIKGEEDISKYRWYQ